MSLAIECGATTSTILYINGTDIRTFQLGSANFKLMTQTEFEGFLRQVKLQLGQNIELSELGIGMPGILDAKDKEVAESIVMKIWPAMKSVWVGSDIETAVSCMTSPAQLKIVVIGGTGSNCFGTDGVKSLKIGGCGHLLGDRGSSYEIGLLGLRAALKEYEHSQQISTEKQKQRPAPNSLLSFLMDSLNTENLTDLISWSGNATKPQIAGLAKIILLARKAGDATASKIVSDCITSLASDCLILLGKFRELGSSSAEIGLTGSLFTMNEDISEMFKDQIIKQIPEGSQVHFTLLKNTVLGALRQLTNDNLPLNLENKLDQIYSQLENKEEKVKDVASLEKELASILPAYLELPVTEQRNPESMHLDTMSLDDSIELMISQESLIYSEIRKEKENIKKLIDQVSISLKSGGRLFYVGCGTSGRLGILDATECPPTFRTQPEMVQGIIAGGFSSVSKAKEGAEDSIVDGMEAVKERFICEKDVVVGIAASGRTPFVWGALHQAKLLGAFTTFLTFNTRLDMRIRPDLVIAMNLGPEVLTGSTRLKSGSATKCVLNMVSTLAMVRMGKCFENLMVDLNPANQKLKQRALRIVLLMTANLENVTEQVAEPILLRNKYDIKKTVLELRQIQA